MKLTNVALNYAYTCDEVETILTASAPEVIPFLHKQDLRLLARKIVAYNIHGFKIHSVYVPGVSAGYVWPRRSGFLYSGKIFSFHIIVSNPNAKKQKAVPKNVSLSYIFDVHAKQLITHLELQEQYRKEYEAYKSSLSALNAKSASQIGPGHTQGNG